MHQELRIGSLEDLFTDHVYCDRTAYYFMSLDCPGGVTLNVTCLDSTDYEEFLVCSMTEGEPCA